MRSQQSSFFNYLQLAPSLLCFLCFFHQDIKKKNYVVFWPFFSGEQSLPSRVDPQVITAPCFIVALTPGSNTTYNVYVFQKKKKVNSGICRLGPHLHPQVRISELKRILKLGQFCTEFWISCFFWETSKDLFNWWHSARAGPHAILQSAPVQYIADI